MPAAPVSPVEGAATRQRVPSVRIAAAMTCAGQLHNSVPRRHGLPTYSSSSKNLTARMPHAATAPANNAAC
eukprot:14732565-Alexandrium_andersonii.AAC.1